MKGKSMHRKKFLSLLGMAAIAAPILAKEIPQADEVKPLELKEGSLGIGKLGMLSEAREPEAVGNGVTVGGPYLSEGQILTYNLVGEGWAWTDPVKGVGTNGIIHTTNKVQWQDVVSGLSLYIYP